MNGCLLTQFFHVLQQLFDWMQKCDNVNVASYSTFFKFMGKSHNLVKALQVYNDIGDECTRYNASVCNALLGCFVRHGKFETSINLFEQMKKGGLTPDIVTYSTLLSGCTKIKDGYSKSLKLMEELKSNGLHMDSVIYGTVLAVCASNNHSKEAENFFQQMVVEGCEPNLFHYSSLLNAYSVDGDYAKAEKLVKDMKSSGIEPNKVILTTLLKVYVRGGLFEKSRELLVKLGTLGHAEEEMPFCILMDGLAKAGQIDEAKVIFQDMKMKGVKSDGYSHSIMISACCRHGLIEDAKQLAEEFEGNNYKYDLVMMNTLLRTYCQAGEMEHVMKVLRKMDELAISPDWNTFQILIKYFYKKKMYSLAFRTVEDMHKKGHQLDEELCSSLMIRLGQNGAASEAFSVYNMLRYSKRTISKALHEKMLNILVSGGLLKDAYVTMKDNIEYISSPSLERFLNSFMRSGNINLINDVLKACNKSSYRINQNVFSLAVSRYVAEPEKKELLLHLLQWMTGQGYCVDSSTRNHILKNSHLFGRHLIADILSKQFAMSRKLQTQKVPGS
ncbi:Pentatricopeptide repeat-containing protein [Nymphaea thermarum]|nr:Pentatricopeptide repeat-containing protein [Nymphaea thermarum]